VTGWRRVTSVLPVFLPTYGPDQTRPEQLYVTVCIRLRSDIFLFPARSVGLPLLRKLGLALGPFRFFLIQLGRPFLALLLPSRLGLVPLRSSHFTKGLLHPLHGGVGLELRPLKHISLQTWYLSTTVSTD
jgi:hypothetical protein